MLFRIFTVAFFGHRYIDSFIDLENMLEKHITELIKEKTFVEFLVGRNGDFDRVASSAVRRVQKKCGDENSALVLVLPYNSAEYTHNTEAFEEYYTDIEISSSAQTVHPKAAIQTRNREMVDRADLIICYVNQDGGAYKTIQYAERKGKKIINLAEN